jgi:transcriptional regulator with XRE-family HTH domain
MMPDDIPIGECVRFYRQGQHKSQPVVAGLAQITESYLSQIERGGKIPTVAVLQRLARVLGVPISVLLGEPAYASESSIHPVAPAIQTALMSYQNAGANPVPTSALRARVNAAWQTWQGTAFRFTGIGPTAT